MNTTIINLEFNGYETVIANDCLPGSNKSTNTAILFIHGNSTGRQIWSQVIYPDNGLEEYGDQIAVDAIGHGQSDGLRKKGQYVNPTIRDQVKVLVKFLEKQEYQYVYLIGHSMGGHIAIQMAIYLASYRYTGELIVKGLVISGTPPVPLKKLEWIEPFNPTDPEIIKLFPLLVKLTPFTPEEARPFTLHQFGGEKNYQKFVTEQQAEQFIKTSVEVSHGGRNIAASLLGDKLDSNIMFDEHEWIQETQMPVMIAHAMDDGAVNLDYLKSLKINNLYQGKVMVFEDQPHGVVYTQGKAFSALLLDFFKGNKAKQLSDDDIDWIIGNKEKIKQLESIKENPCCQVCSGYLKSEDQFFRCSYRGCYVAYHVKCAIDLQTERCPMNGNWGGGEHSGSRVSYYEFQRYISGAIKELEKSNRMIREKF